MKARNILSGVKNGTIHLSTERFKDLKAGINEIGVLAKGQTVDLVDLIKRVRNKGQGR